MSELHQNVDLLYKLSPFIFAIGAQFIAFLLLKQKFNDHLEEYKENKKLQWEKFDALKITMEELNLSMVELNAILKISKKHGGLEK